MKFAYCKIITTPQHPVNMSGYKRESQSIGVQRDLEANVMLLDFAGIRWLHIVIDAINVDAAFTNRMRQHFSHALKMDAHHVSVTATHTHSSVAYFELVFDGSTGTPKEVDDLAKKIMEGTQDLEASLQEGTVHHSTYTFSDFYSNRNLLSGSCDHQGTLLEFYTSEQVKAFALFNISVHPTFYNGSNLLLSPDLIGEIRTQIAGQLGVLTMVTNGACGDVSSRFFRQQFPTLQAIGETFLKQFKEQYQPQPIDLSYKQLILHQETMAIDHRNDPVDQVLLNQLKQENSPMNQLFQQRLALKASWGAFDLALESTILHLGSLLIVLLPGDVCSDFGHQLKVAAGSLPTIVVGYSNQYCNYMVPHQDYGLYFETFTSRFHYGQADRFFDHLKAKILNLA